MGKRPTVQNQLFSQFMQNSIREIFSPLLLVEKNVQVFLIKHLTNSICNILHIIELLYYFFDAILHHFVNYHMHMLGF